MKKHFEKASVSFAKGGAIHLMDIDCGHEAFCNLHSISGYPSVKLLRKDGTSESYDGPRTYQAMTGLHTQCVCLHSCCLAPQSRPAPCCWSAFVCIARLVAQARVYRASRSKDAVLTAGD